MKITSAPGLLPLLFFDRGTLSDDRNILLHSNMLIFK